MPRRKLSEYRSKQIIHKALDLPYVGWDINIHSIARDLKEIKGASSYVVKVDQAVKGRFKRGLVTLDVPKKDIEAVLKKYSEEGFEHFIVEPFVTHENHAERYLCILHDRDGMWLRYSKSGGVDIEANPESITTTEILDDTDWSALADATAFSVEQLRSLIHAYKQNFFTFLEINPYIQTGNSVALLDLAIEVDDAGQSFVHDWTSDDLREPNKTIYPQEEVVHALDQGSAASFNLSVINPNGSIFLLLSGGGASVVIADEVYNQGLGGELANYGEYSGNPQAHEAQKYTSEVLQLLIASRAAKKVLFIGGAVANFTDIATTFGGVIAAIDENAAKLTKQKVKIYVRRGGPRQEIGLANIRKALEKHGLLGGVYDPSTTITDALGAALEGLRK
jgi:ATP-citrate lyase beta-subunit